MGRAFKSSSLQNDRNVRSEPSVLMSGFGPVAGINAI